MSMGKTGGSPIEEFLDSLLLASTGARPRATRHLLSETEAHLRDIADEVTKAGGTPAEGEEAAVARFGSVEALVRAEAKSRHLPFSALIRPAVATSLLLGGLAGLAMGVSGVITAIMGYVGGGTFIVDISHRTHFAPSDCARWLSQNHSTHSCYQAALQDWTFEEVAYRVVLGVLGLVALLGYWQLGRRWSARHLICDLPRGSVDAVAFVAFSAFGVWLAGMGVDSLVVSGGRGAGSSLGTAPALLVLGAVFGWRLITDFRASLDRPLASG